jgi:hypothetical protein
MKETLQKLLKLYAFPTYNKLKKLSHKFAKIILKEARKHFVTNVKTYLNTLVHCFKLVQFT